MKTYTSPNPAIKVVFLAFLFYCFPVLKTNAQVLWGTAAIGQYGFGEIFSMPTGSTNISVAHSFTGYPGENPYYGNVILAGNGKLYGMASGGGLNNHGIIFSYDTLKGVYTDVHDFNLADGNAPYGSLIVGPKGYLYGMTQYGGSHNFGVIFRVDTNSNYKILHSFDTIINGTYPFGSLLLASDGLLYGMTRQGGVSNLGVLFSIDTSGNYTALVNFTSSNYCHAPFGSLIQASNGLLYGMTSAGGTNFSGNIFSYNTTTKVITNLYSFNGGSTGGTPYGSLLQAANGKLYGMTNSGGGATNPGILFSYDFNLSTFTVLLSFTSTNGTNPYGSLIQGENGKLYGLSTSTIFSYNITKNSYSKIFSFGGTSGGGAEGSLMQAPNGKLYGFTSAGGVAGYGVLFLCDTLGNYTKKIDFNYAPFGCQPGKSLLQADNGKLYGMTYKGGTSNFGVIYSYDPVSLKYVVIYNFNGTIGAEPLGSLIQAPNGKLYGLATYGGSLAYGDIFSCDTVGNFKVIYDFNNTLGANPSGSLLLLKNGKLYGTTETGGTYSHGVIFSYDTTKNIYTVLHHFNTADGTAPVGSLTQAINGKLYGTAPNGSGGDGVVFSYDTTGAGTFKVVVSFNFTNGELPQDNLLQLSNGIMYGTAQGGGSLSSGELFSLDTGKLFTKRYYFPTASGSGPMGTPIMASNNKMYGTTSAGGKYNKGVIFEYDTLSKTYVDKYDFSSQDGNPSVDLIETIGTLTAENSINYHDRNNVKIYPNPSKGLITLQINNEELKKSKLAITIYNILGEEVYSQSTTNNSKFTIDLGTKSTGVYFYRIITETGDKFVAEGKLMIQQ